MAVGDNLAFSLIFGVAPALLGVLVGWRAHRPAVGARVAGVGLVGLCLTIVAALQYDGSDKGDGFEDLGEGLTVVILAVGFGTAFGVLGVFGLGALAGAWLRKLR